ncbi:uncharacterized protein MONOS_13511 [Monocercomonoides exilis]|uniref:uncharacterized protein n=1 Tax=Monocercomonoides exilis TaxID=2049356 RepID=UPI003559E7A5|nr:hypothetical protein MONOS_13511 [Monocercomonoides exilis]|eukprot:MONOS_13511.1-p1 / transcript=MONOS_13511.1 / gene=MONOS_13511 / organism=Monocercomonoides_exilis_PA203 / gene_product=unspecified product / transcript_product=unspecified product / location=Mono_scaffold00838:17522-18028(+) / protein_length=102 / sequence_SO=supercontig / SO=protein_coding / is_pseudo=false
MALMKIDEQKRCERWKFCDSAPHINIFDVLKEMIVFAKIGRNGHFSQKGWAAWNKIEMEFQFKRKRIKTGMSENGQFLLMQSGCRKGCNKRLEYESHDRNG